MIAKVLLLGGGGFVGQNLARTLILEGFSVTIIDQYTSGVRDNSDLAAVACHEISLGETSLILNVIEECSIDCVINLASSLMPSSNFSMFIEDMEKVVTPSLALLTELAARGIQYVFFSSGGTVYGHGGPELIDESSRCEPINFYGQSKKTMEDFIIFAGRSLGLKYLIIRPSNPYGRYQNPLRKQGFIAVALHQMMHNLPVEIWGDGSVVRDYLYVEDLTQAVSLLLRSGVSNEIFNVASGCGYAIHEILSKLSEVTGIAADVRYQSSRKVDVQSIILDIRKVQSFVPFIPLDLTSGIKKYYGYLRGCDAK